MRIKDILSYHGLLNTALEDGVITMEERLLLENISENYKDYQAALNEALVDGVIGDDEAEGLRELRKKIYSDALKTAMKSGAVSKDERGILEVLKKSLKLDKGVLKAIEEEALVKHKMYGYAKFYK